MIQEKAEAIVAGHICFDVIPQFKTGDAPNPEQLFMPGALLEVGPAVMSLGGAVANTGVALHRLGVRTELMARVGDDFLGRAVLEKLREHGPRLAQGIRICQGESTSYSAILNPPGTDRMILHCPGANDGFEAGDVPVDRLSGRRLFHFGYPTLMRRLLSPDGQQLQEILGRARNCNLITSLDMTRPDPNSPAGHLDWEKYLSQVLPLVDVFLPSLEELVLMLDRGSFEKLCRQGAISVEELSRLSDRLLEMGTSAAVIKLGRQGLYMRTASRLGEGAVAKATSGSWRSRELLAPAFRVRPAGTTGAGDCAIAGFLTALLRGSSPSACLNSAAAAGAASVERSDAVSGVPNWETLLKRIDAGWERRTVDFDLEGWRWSESRRIWAGPRD